MKARDVGLNVYMEGEVGGGELGMEANLWASSPSTRTHKLG